jgi:hypothetical protein
MSVIVWEGKPACVAVADPTTLLGVALAFVFQFFSHLGVEILFTQQEVSSHISNRVPSNNSNVLTKEINIKDMSG